MSLTWTCGRLELRKSQQTRAITLTITCTCVTSSQQCLYDVSMSQSRVTVQATCSLLLACQHRSLSTILRLKKSTHCIIVVIQQFEGNCCYQQIKFVGYHEIQSFLFSIIVMYRHEACFILKWRAKSLRCYIFSPSPKKSNMPLGLDAPCCERSRWVEGSLLTGRGRHPSCSGCLVTPLMS